MKIALIIISAVAMSLLILSVTILIFNNVFSPPTVGRDIDDARENVDSASESLVFDYEKVYEQTRSNACTTHASVGLRPKYTVCNASVEKAYLAENYKASGALYSLQTEISKKVRKVGFATSSNNSQGLSSQSYFGAFDSVVAVKFIESDSPQPVYKSELLVNKTPPDKYNQSEMRENDIIFVIVVSSPYDK